MAPAVDSNFIKSNTRDGSYLKHCRKKGGIGMGMIAVGAMLAGATAFFGVSLGAAMELPPAQTAVIYGTAAAFVIVFIIPGVILHKKRLATYLDYYSKTSGYTTEQLKEMDKEVNSADSVLINPYVKASKLATSLSGVITPHWCKFSGNYKEIFRLADIAAIWFDKGAFINNQQIGPTLFFIDSRGQLTYHLAQEAPAMETIEEITKRNKKTITVRNFTYDNREYDAYKMPMETAELYRSVH